MEKLLYLVTFLSILGAYLNSKNNVLGFYIWIFTNSIFAANNLFIGEYAQTLLFSVFILTSINGVFNHASN